MSDNVIHVDFTPKPVEEELIIDFDVFNSYEWPNIEISFDPRTPEDYPNPVIEKTLFGWVAHVFDTIGEEWIELPHYYESKCAAETAAEAMLLAIDFELSIDYEPDQEQKNL